jgi:hypothetical protein
LNNGSKYNGEKIKQLAQAYGNVPQIKPKKKKAFQKQTAMEQVNSSNEED